MGLRVRNITQVVAGKQGKAVLAALASLASDLAANVACAGVERLAAARGEDDNILVRAGRKGQAGLETLAHANHARFEFESANSTGGWFGTHLLRTGYDVARRVTSADRQPAQNPATATPEQCHALGRAAENAGDLAQAFRFYRQAAEAGYAPAQNDLGVCYQDGRGTSPDLAQAQLWYRSAAECGHVEAQVNLGFSLEQSDPAQAAHWLRNAALAGDKEALKWVTRHDAKASQPPPQGNPPERGSVAWARKTLGVGPQASPADIKAAHLRLITLLHPDKGGFNEDAADLNDARRVLLAR